MTVFRFWANSRQIWRLFFMPIIIGLFFVSIAYAHPSPNSLVFLDIQPSKVTVEVQMPVPELELAFGHQISQAPELIVKKWEAQLREYILAHMHAYVTKDHLWSIKVVSMKMDHGMYADSITPYWEVNASIEIVPQKGESTRNFFLDYDVIMHQVMNHAALVSIRSDWETGQLHEQSAEPAVIGWNFRDNRIDPLKITLGQGSWIKGFISMIRLGMAHILEGTDHLLFLIVLLLPATLTTDGRKWGAFAGTRNSLIKLLKIVSSFTIGHSIALIASALGVFTFPSQPIEILIAISILVSAVHAIHPIFPEKETYVAGGFGLVHGLAFSTTISELKLNSGALALSILGFNTGIEIMQLFIVVIIVPWIMLISDTKAYSNFRIIGASSAGIAALGWILARSLREENFVTKSMESIPQYPYHVAAVLILTCLTIFIGSIYQSRKGRA